MNYHQIKCDKHNFQKVEQSTIIADKLITKKYKQCINCGKIKSSENYTLTFVFIVVIMFLLSACYIVLKSYFPNIK